MNISYLLIGGNQGDRLLNLQKTCRLINEQAGNIEKSSAMYETAAWGKTDQPAFLNQAILLHTALPATSLMPQLLSIEQQMGRIRDEKYGPRIIDIDIIFFNDEIIDLPTLKIPHPQMAFRRFVLAPLSEIAPLFIHPVQKKNVITLLSECTDPLDVKKL